MVEKRLLCSHRLRRTPAQFSWLDHRLVRERRLLFTAANGRL